MLSETHNTDSYTGNIIIGNEVLYFLKMEFLITHRC